MEINLKHEMLVFWGAFFCGQIIFVLFDFFRSLRKNCACGKKMVAVQDIIFCSLSFKIFFDVCYITNNGHMRWYIFVSLILSAIIYFLTESAFIMKIWNVVFKILGFVLRPAVKFLSFVKGLVKRLLGGAKTGLFTFFGTIKGKIGQIAVKKQAKPHENSDVI